MLLPLVALLSLGATARCPDGPAAIVVDTALHELVLCEAGGVQRTFRVALGEGGTSAGRVKWAQTPLGRFELGPPRPSKQFHVFVPLKNPNPKRFSAWAIGLHGPPRESKDAGDANVERDWTWGCIAVASDEEIDAIAQWVRSTRARRVDFR